MRFLSLVFAFQLLSYSLPTYACDTSLLTIKAFSVCLPSDTEIAHRIRDDKFHITVIDRIRGTTLFDISEIDNKEVEPAFSEAIENETPVSGLNESKCAIRKHTGLLDTGENIIEAVIFSLDTKVEIFLVRENYIYDALIQYCRHEA